jgi:hypothetical protein
VAVFPLSLDAPVTVRQLVPINPQMDIVGQQARSVFKKRCAILLDNVIAGRSTNVSHVFGSKGN